MADIHPTAIIDPKAEIDEDCKIGPYCILGPGVRLAKGVELHGHVVIQGETSLGEACEVFPFASLGTKPQDLKYKGEKSYLVIGKRNRIREQVTMNPGTEGGGFYTRVGDDNLFMVGAHVAHDCVIADKVVMANNATLAGHVVVEESAVIGGLAAVHQFVRIGCHAMIGGMSGVESMTSSPTVMAFGERACLAGDQYRWPQAPAESTATVPSAPCSRRL